jgi:hypothetical protein
MANDAATVPDSGLQGFTNRPSKKALSLSLEIYELFGQ